MTDNFEPSDPNIEALGREWLRRRLAGELDRAQLADGFPNDDSAVARSFREFFRKLLGESFSLTYIASEETEQGTTHRFRLSFNVEMEYLLGLTRDGKLRRFSLQNPTNRRGAGPQE